MDQNKEKFDFSEILIEIRNKLFLIIILVVVAGVLGFVVSRYIITPEYEATVNMIVNTKQDNTGTVTNDNITSAQKLVDTYSIIIKSNTVLNKVIENLNLNLDYNDLVEKVSVEAVNDTQIMRIAVRDKNKELAKEIVEQIKDIAPAVIVDTAEVGSCKPVSYVTVGEDPVFPNVKRSVEISVILALILSLIIIVIIAVTKVKRIIDDEDVATYLELPVLGVLPEVGGEGK